MHELSLAEENYGFASEDYSSILAFRAMVAAMVFSVTIILSAFVLFSILVVEVFVSVITYWFIINLMALVCKGDFHCTFYRMHY